MKVPVPGGKAVALLDLLAQTRTEYVPADAKLVEGEAALFPVPAVRIPIEEEGVRSTGLVHACVACAPALHLWKKLEKEEPVDALPMLETVAEKVRAVPAVALVGEESPAVRSGAGALTTTFVQGEQLLSSAGGCGVSVIVPEELDLDLSAQARTE